MTFKFLGRSVRLYFVDGFGISYSKKEVIGKAGKRAVENAIAEVYRRYPDEGDTYLFREFPPFVDSLDSEERFYLKPLE